MQSINIARLLSYYASTDANLHSHKDAASYTHISQPSVKAYTTRAIQLGWLLPADEGFAVTPQGEDLIQWIAHGEERAYI